LQSATSAKPAKKEPELVKTDQDWEEF